MSLSSDDSSSALALLSSSYTSGSAGVAWSGPGVTITSTWPTVISSSSNPDLKCASPNRTDPNSPLLSTLALVLANRADLRSGWPFSWLRFIQEFQSSAFPTLDSFCQTRSESPAAAPEMSCRSTKTQVNPGSALNRSKHHQSNPSNVPGILDSNLFKRACVYTSKSLTT